MKKHLLTISLVALVALLLGGLAYLYIDLRKQRQENKDMEVLADINKREMENEYQQFARQYGEMKTQINNDSIVAQLTAEQEKTQRLLEELRHTRSTNAREITRLKRELATVRAVLRSYVLEIDSLNRLNQNLTAENTRIKGQYEEASRQIEGLNSEKASLSEQVAIAAQLDATGLQMALLDKHGKAKNKISKAKNVQVTFAIAKNVTARAGQRSVYVRITSPTGALMGNAGTFNYENKMLVASMKKVIEYGGQETPVQLYMPVTQALTAGSYVVSVFADGQMIGSRTFSFQ